MARRDKTGLRRIPGVGASIEEDFLDMGITSLAALRGRDPEELFEQLCALRGTRIDRCVLYVFRLAVYFATQDEPDPQRLKWWLWKDAPADKPGRARAAGKKVAAGKGAGVA